MGELSEAFAQTANAITNIRQENRESRRLDLFANEMQARTMMDQIRLRMEQELQPLSVATINEKLKNLQVERTGMQADIKASEEAATRLNEAWESGKPFRDFTRGIGERLNTGLSAQTANGGNVPPISPSTRGAISTLLDAGVPASLLGLPDDVAQRGNITGFMSPDLGINAGSIATQLAQRVRVGGILGMAQPAPKPKGDIFGAFGQDTESQKVAAKVAAERAAEYAVSNASPEAAQVRTDIQQLLASPVFATSPSTQQDIVELLASYGVNSLADLGKFDEHRLTQMRGDLIQRQNLMESFRTGVLR